MLHEDPSSRFKKSSIIRGKLLEREYRTVDLVHIESVDQLGYLLHKSDKSYDKICVLNPMGVRNATNEKAFKRSLYGRSLAYVDKIEFKSITAMLNEV